jgi:hypothetical protein
VVEPKSLRGENRSWHISSACSVIFPCSEYELTTFKILPFVIPLVYSVWLPKPAVFEVLELPPSYDTDDLPITDAYTPLALSDDTIQDDEGATAPPGTHHRTIVGLTVEDKRRLVKPLILRYMLPLCAFLPVFVYASYS